MEQILIVNGLDIVKNKTLLPTSLRFKVYSGEYKPVCGVLLFMEVLNGESERHHSCFARMV